MTGPGRGHDGVDGAAADAGRWRRARVHVWVALAVIVGVLLGAGLGMPVGGWLIAASGAVAGTLWMMRRGADRAARWGALVGVVALMAGWSVLRAGHVAAHDIARYVGEEAQLAEVVGVVASEPRLRTPRRGAFGAFSYAPPGTMLVLDVRSVVVAGEAQPATGGLLVRIDGADPRLQFGQVVRAAGWLSAIEGPVNPGEWDYRAWYAQRGVRGRLTVPSRGNWSLLTDAPHGGWHVAVQAARQSLANVLRRGLWLGMEAEGDGAGARMALLEALLLGRWRPEADEISEPFRRVGLAHLLSISGAHLGILLGLTWGVVRLAVGRPSRAAMVMLVVLGLYMAAVPLRVPIVRAAIMAAIFCGGAAAGRGLNGLAMLAWATVVVLVWRPGDLFEPGFQLSFGVVAGLLLFVRPLTLWVWPSPEVDVVRVRGMAERAARWGLDYLAVSVVAFAVALPVVAYHYQLVSPWAVLLSVLTLPVVTAVLGLGYLKMLLAVVLPSGSLLLSGPLAWVADAMLALVEHAAAWPGAGLELAARPSLAWVVGTLAVTTALLAGAYQGRRVALVLSTLLLAGWTTVEQRPGWFATPSGDAAVRVESFMVGDGSCHLVRLHGEGGAAHTLMFDCGSQAYLDVGLRSIVPALRELGVARLDTLVISHADMDHYAGCLDVIDAVAVGRVLVPTQLLDEAKAQPEGATAFLVAELRRRGLEPTAVMRGWRERAGGAELSVLWPTADFEARRANDTSLVLSVRAAGRRLLLTGDIQEPAIAALLATGDDLRADVTELPHHGGMDPGSPRWLQAVQPSVVLQSCSPARLRRDPWRGRLDETRITRLITAERGMLTLTIAPDGTMAWRGLRDGP